jgi:hypothetical protein
MSYSHFHFEISQHILLTIMAYLQHDSDLRILATLTFVRETSMSFRQPRMVCSNGISVKLPDLIDDDRLSDELSKNNIQPEDQPSLMEYYNSTIRLDGILGEALEKAEAKTLPSTKVMCKLRGILELDNSIMKGRQSLPPHLKYKTAFEKLRDAPRSSRYSRSLSTAVLQVSQTIPARDMELNIARDLCTQDSSS